ncbi:hypothetical protein [Ferruginibacter sp. HRS2-29]|uniref:hypothetical protein n=1 Tax=Ferruginibacter sp. HRS2-29 TaxID=2487334 RepID=UPI0020CEC6AE|nr:hypothetical protein [Ferruginibacter sp. HRS2-29]
MYELKANFAPLRFFAPLQLAPPNGVGENPSKIIHSKLLKANFSILAVTNSVYAVFTAGNFRFVSRRSQHFIRQKYPADQAQYFAWQG